MKIIDKLIMVAASAMMFALMVLMVFDVVGRNVFNRPVQGATELTEIGLVTITFLLFPALALRKAHIIADVADAFQSRVLDVLKVLLTAVLGAGMFGLMSWRIWLLALNSAGYNEASPTLQVPLSPFLFGASVFAGICALCFIAGLRELPKALSNQRSEADPTKTIL